VALSDIAGQVAMLRRSVKCRARKHDCTIVREQGRWARMEEDGHGANLDNVRLTI
jgi:hypothetical protein